MRHVSYANYIFVRDYEAKIENVEFRRELVENRKSRGKMPSNSLNALRMYFERNDNIQPDVYNNLHFGTIT